MSILEILQIGAPCLRQKARDLTHDELLSPRWQSFIDDLISTMRVAHGAGLAANQVGQSVRICVIEVRADNPRYSYKPPIDLTVLVNPEITLLGEETFENYEGCLSVPDLRGIVTRHTRIHIRFLDRHGEIQEKEVNGLAAVTYQHECDHLDGKLFVDRVSNPETLCTWENFVKHHEADFVSQVRATFGR